MHYMTTGAKYDRRVLNAVRANPGLRPTELLALFLTEESYARRALERLIDSDAVRVDASLRVWAAG